MPREFATRWFDLAKGWVGRPEALVLAGALVLLVAIWLLVRRDRRAVAGTRPAPLSVDDLGRAIFRAARDSDVHAYRALFLDEGEALQLLGDDATEYRRALRPRTVARALEGIAAQLPDDAVFVGMKNQGVDRWALRVADGQTRVVLVDAGILVTAANVWRIFGPPRPPGT